MRRGTALQCCASMVSLFIPRCLLGLALLLCLAAAVPAMAADRVLTLGSGTPASASLTQYFDVLDDTSAQLSLADVQRPEVAGRFKSDYPNGEALGFSYTRSALWLRLHVKNTTDQPVERMLEVAYALLAQVDIYQTAQGQVQHQILTGYARPFAARAHPSRFFVVPVTLPPGADSVFYLRVMSANSINIPARLWEPQAFHVHERQDYAVQAFYFGIVMAIGIYNLMLFFALRDVNYLLYVAFAANVALGLATFNGISTQYLWDVPAYTMAGVNVPAAVAGIAILLFTRRVLGTPQLLPRMDKVLLVFVGVNAASIPGLLLWFQAYTPYFVVLSLLTSLLLLVTGIVCAIKKQRSAYYFVVAFTAILVAIVLSHLRNLGVLPTNVFTAEGTQIGSAMEMLLLSFALADRYNAMRREKVIAQSEALIAQGVLVESLKSSEQMLETRVQERTHELSVLNKKLEAMSATDGLTGIANRRHFDEAFAHEWQRAARTGQPLAVGMMDVDYFKKYNDHYGHHAGDECLRTVARALSEAIGRTEDVVARYGGEEFVFFAPNTGAEAANTMASRMCASLYAMDLPHATSELGRVTVSIGVVSLWATPDCTAQDMLKAADAALYSAKNKGRNQTVLGSIL